MKQILRLDSAALLVLRTRCHTRFLDRMVIAYAWCGESGALWLAVCAVAMRADRKHRHAWLATASAVSAALAANYALKLVVRRPRPEIDGLRHLGRSHRTDSFPSGHAATSFAAATAAPAWRRRLLAAATAMALTRPYLGVHYPADVAGGAVLGSVIGLGVRNR